MAQADQGAGSSPQGGSGAATGAQSQNPATPPAQSKPSAATPPTPNGANTTDIQRNKGVNGTTNNANTGPTPSKPGDTTGNASTTTSDPSRTTSNPARTTKSTVGTTSDTVNTTSDPSRRTINMGTVNQNNLGVGAGVQGTGNGNAGALGTAGLGQTRTSNQPIDDYNQNTRPAIGSPRPAGTGVDASRPQNRIGNLGNPQVGLGQSLDNAYGRTLNNPATLGPNARGGFFPTPPAANNGLKPNAGYNVQTGARPSHMDARGIQRVN